MRYFQDRPGIPLLAVCSIVTFASLLQLTTPFFFVDDPHFGVIWGSDHVK